MISKRLKLIIKYVVRVLVHGLHIDRVHSLVL